MADDGKKRPGRRKDGQPYKEGNTREDGSYRHGKNRPPVKNRFAVGDGRARGVRPKGHKNLATDWREELATKISITEGGVVYKVTKQRATIKAQIDRAMKKSDQAATTVFQFAALAEKRDPGFQADDLAIIDAWLEQVMNTGNSDDLDEQLDDTMTDEEDPATDEDGANG